MRGEPPCMKRVLDTVEWAVRKFKIDRNRIYLCGNSMGGQGALAIGLRHGEVFAAVNANVPATIVYPAAQMGFIDFAGSTAVHMGGGVAAFIGAKFLGPRIGKYDKDGKSHAFPGHSLTLGALGVFDDKPRTLSPRDVMLLGHMADEVMQAARQQAANAPDAAPPAAS